MPSPTLPSPRVIALGGVAAVLAVSAVSAVVYLSTSSSSAGAHKASKKGQQTQKGAEEVVVTGYRNIGNTCFLNCILQALASLPAFGQYLRELLHYAEKHPTPSTAPSTFQPSSPSFASLGGTSLHSASSALSPPTSSRLLLQFLACFNGEVSNPTALYHSLVAEATQFRGFQQNDSHELFLAIMQLLSSRINPHLHIPTLHNAGFSFHDLLVQVTSQPPPLQKPPAEAEETKEEATADDVAAAEASKAAVGVHAASDAAPPTDPFQGLLAQLLQCQRCGYQSPVSHSAFIALTLPLPRHPAISTWDIHRCLVEFCSAEQVEGVRCALCSAAETRKAVALLLDRERERKATDKRRLRSERLKQQLATLTDRLIDMRPTLATQLPANPTPSPIPPSASPNGLFSPAVSQAAVDPSTFLIAEHAVRTRMTKRTVLARLPRLLCLHLNRLCGERKLSTRVDFPSILNMAYFTADYDDYAAVGHRRAKAGEEAVPRVSPRVLYRLCSVVCHHGGSGSGHFTCYRSHERYKRVGGEERKEGGEEEGERERVWVHVSDDRVRRVTWDEVLACEAYLLFYHRIDR